VSDRDWWARDQLRTVGSARERYSESSPLRHATPSLVAPGPRVPPSHR